MRGLLSLLFVGMLSWARVASADPLSVWPSPLAVAPAGDGSVAFDLVVVNTGLEPASEVVLRDTLTLGARLISASPPPTVTGRALRWSLGEVLPGASVRVRLRIAGGTDTGARLEGGIAASRRTATARPATVLAAADDALSPTLDADAADPEVLAFVARFGGDFDLIAAHVRSHFRFEAYAGSLRGARGALWSEAGNAVDLASLMVASARACGHPARYAFAALPDDAIDRFLLRMFEASYDLIQGDVMDPDRVITHLLDPVWRAENFDVEMQQDFATRAFDEPELRAILFPDPIQDPVLRAAVRPHAWARVTIDGQVRDVDVTQTLAPPAAERVANSVDEAMRHHVSISVISEDFNAAFGSPLADQGDTTLVARVPTVQLNGRPLELRFESVTDISSGLLFGVIAHTYTPILSLDGSTLATGQAIQEIVTNFPAASNLLTGLFVDVRSTGPGGVGAESFRHVILDRIGFAARHPGELDLASDPVEVGQAPAVSPFHRTLIHVSGGQVPEHVGAGSSWHTKRLTEAGFRDIVAPLQAFTDANGDQAILPPELMGYYEDTRRLAGDLGASRARSAGLKFLHASAGFNGLLAAHHTVVAYPDRARLVFAEAREVAGEGGFAMNVVRGAIFATNRPGQMRAGVTQFRFARGLMDKTLESEVIEGFVPPGARIVSWERLLVAAADQAIAMRLVMPDNHLDLLRLALPQNVVSRIQADLEAGRAVLCPESPPLIDGSPAFLWLAYDQETGEATVTDVDGHHAAAGEYGISLGVLWKASAAGVNAGALAGGAIGVLVGAFDVVRSKRFGGTKGSGFYSGAASLCGVNAGSLFAGSLAAVIKEGLKAGYTALAGGGVGNIAAKIALCVGFVAGYALGAVTVGVLLTSGGVVDPPIAPLDAHGRTQVRPQGPPHANRQLVTLEGGPVVAPPAGGPARASGTLILTADGALETGPAQVIIDGESVSVSAVRVDGVARLSLDGALAFAFDHTSGQGRFEGLIDVRVGEVLIDGSWQDVPSGDLSISGFSAEGIAGLTLPIDVTLDAEDGTVTWESVAWSGVSGSFGLGPSGAVPSGHTGALALPGLPPSLALSRGETVALDLSPFTTAAGDYVVEAVGPEGWNVALRDGTRLTMSPRGGDDFFDGDGPSPVVQVWVRSISRPDAVAGAVISLVPTLAPDPSLGVSIEHDPLYTNYAEGLHLPLAFPVELRNRGELPVESVLAATVPAGFRARLPQPTLSLAPGQLRRLFVLVEPIDLQAPLPAAGSPFTVRFEANVPGSPVAADEVTIGFPGITRVLTRFEPSTLTLSAAESADVTLVVVGVGNLESTLDLLEPNRSARFVLEGVPDELRVSPQDTLNIPVRVTLSADAPTGLMYATEVHFFDRPLQTKVGIAVLAADAVTPENAGLTRIADDATAIGRDDLAAQLYGLAASLERIAFRCRAVEVDRVLKLLTAMIADLSDEVYAGVRADLALIADSLLARDCAILDVDALVANLESLRVIFIGLRDHDFRLALTPSGALRQPGIIAELGATFEKLGREDTNLVLAVLGPEGLVAVVDSPVNPAPLLVDHPVAVSSPLPGDHTFRLVAFAAEAPEIRRTVVGHLVVATQHVAVTAVGANPPFAVPGSQLNLFVDVFNVANRPQTLEATWELLRPDGSVVATADERVPLRLLAIQGTQRLALGRAQLRDEEPGTFSIRVQLYEPGTDLLVPGGQGEGRVLVGLPFDVGYEVSPPRLPPGSVNPTVSVRTRRRPAEVLPALGRVLEIERFSSNAFGPSGVAVMPDGSIFFANYGNTRSSDDVGHEDGATIGRIAPDGLVTQFAVVPNSPADVTVGPDGFLYVVNVGPPERITRLDPANAIQSTYYDFSVRPPIGGGEGANITQVKFGPDGQLYGADLIEPFLFGISRPGKRVYRVGPDAGGAIIATSIVSDGLASPGALAIDPRTSDLILSDQDNDRVVRINTIGPSTITPLFPSGRLSGFHFDDAGNLFGVRDDTGELIVWETAIVDGHTTLVGAPSLVAGGLVGPIDLTRDAQGRFITTSFELSEIMRIQFTDDLNSTLAVAVSHPAAATRIAGSERPLGAVIDADGVHWNELIEIDDEALDFNVDHELFGLVPGDVVTLSGPTRVAYREGVEDPAAALELPPFFAIVDHLVGLMPDSAEVRTGDSARFTLKVHNVGAGDESYVLSVTGLAVGLTADLQAGVNVVSGQTVDVPFTVSVAGEAALGATNFTVTARSTVPGSGAVDRVTGSITVTGQGVEVTVDPPRQVVTTGSEAVIRVIFERDLGDTCGGGFIVSEGLAAIAADGRETFGIVEFNGQENTKAYEVRRLVGAKPGVYSIMFKMAYANGFYRCGGELSARAVVEVTGDEGLSITTDPPENTIFREEPFTLHTVIRNNSPIARDVTLSRCCTDFYWDPVFEAGPHHLGPGQSKRVPISMTLKFNAGDEQVHDLTVVDVNDPRQVATHRHRTHIRPAAGRMDLLEPREVVAENGEARFTVRFTRPFFDAEHVFRLEVQGALTFSAEPQVIDVDMAGQNVVDVPVVLRDLNNLGPGPFAVRFVGTRDDVPEAPYIRTGSVTIPAGVPSGRFLPASLQMASAAQAVATLVLRNGDFMNPHTIDLAFSGLPDLRIVAPDSVEVPPGAEVPVIVRLSPAAPGSYLVTATLTEAGLPVAAPTLGLNVLDPALAPAFERVDLIPAATEGAPFTVRPIVRDADDPQESLTLRADLDGDLVFETPVSLADGLPLLYPDNGAFPIALEVVDPQGARAVTSLILVVENVAPRFVSDPPDRATEGTLFVYAPVLFDPGLDVLTLSVIEGPNGAVIVDNVLRWTPDAAFAALGLASFRVRVIDDDGASTEQVFAVTVRVADVNGDGVPDSCAAAFGLGPAGDADGDGRPDAEECLRGSSPVGDGRPSAPELLAPEDGAVGLSAQPTFEIAAATDPDGDPLTYRFEVRIDEEGVDDVERLSVVSESGEVDALEWVTDEALADGVYRFRARAHDGAAFGAFSETFQFRVGEIPDAALSPDFGVDPQSDSGVGPQTDSGVDPQTDSGVDPQTDSTVDPEGDSAVGADLSPAIDAPVGPPPDDGGSGVDAVVNRDSRVRDARTDPLADAVAPDAESKDVEVADGGARTVPPFTDSCGCRTSSTTRPPVPLIAALGFLIVLRRRRSGRPN